MKKTFVYVLCAALVALACVSPASLSTVEAAPTPKTPSAGPAISSITTNASSYLDGIVPRFARFEITFQVDTIAQNLQLPYDANPPPGVAPGVGVTVNALFTPDNWTTVYTQPAFYYQEFDDQVKSGQEWFYPNGAFSWKVRFAPDREGAWQFRLEAQDSGGSSQSSVFNFEVGPSTNPGFVRLSSADSRYFEFDDGSYFPALGYNMNFDHVSWNNPVLDNQANFQIMSQNGIQLVRIWLSEWGIYDVYWNPWNPIDPSLAGSYFAYPGTNFEQAYPGSDVSMKIDAGYNPCMFIGWLKASPAVKRDTTYRVRVRFKLEGVSGPRQGGSPYGFTAKLGGWLWGSGNMCQDSGVGTVVMPYQSTDTAGWQILEGSFTTGEYDFLPNFYLVMENAADGTAYVDTVWIEEDLGNGSYGANIVSKPWMAHHLYMEQRNSYAFDKMLALAEQYRIYLRPVVMEKNSWIFDRIDYGGNPVPDDPACWDSDPNNDPPECPDNRWFYGNWRDMTKGRWLQQAWWRYLQARWGYSTSIQSWELLNEGDPWNGLHYTLADEFGLYMHQYLPDDHLVSTSNWHSFPKDAFWANPDYPNVDFADYHQYLSEGDPLLEDTALANYTKSMEIGALTPGGAGKPTVWGETAFTASGSGASPFGADTDGIWLHNFIWANVNSGGLITSYWYENTHIYQAGPGGTLLFDHRNQYGAYYKFIRGVPLNNGDYQDAAVVSVPGLRAWGQKDPVHGQAHLWIQNEAHTWRNVVNGVPIQPLSGALAISGFTPGEDYLVQWWDTYPSSQPLPILRLEHLIAAGDGSLTLQVTDLTSDVAVKILPQPVVDEWVYLPVLSY